MKKTLNLILVSFIVFAFCLIPVSAQSNNDKQLMGKEVYYTEHQINNILDQLNRDIEVKSNDYITMETSTQRYKDGVLKKTIVKVKESKRMYDDGSVDTSYVILAAGNWTQDGYDGSYSIKTTLQVGYDMRVFSGLECFKETYVKRTSTVLDSQFRLGTVSGVYGQAGYAYTSGGVYTFDSLSGNYQTTNPSSGTSYTTYTGYTNYIIASGYYYMGANVTTNFVRIANGQTYSFTFGISRP